MIRAVLFLVLAGWLAVCPGVWAGENWTVYEDCQFLPDRYHDGDSFWLRARKAGAARSFATIFRLYGVDCPEADAGQKPARIAEQARYFRLPPEEVPVWGAAAAALTSRVLREAKAITVATRKTDAGGQSRRNRYYAFVTVDGRDLGELLVENGLARAYGLTAEWNGRSAENLRSLLDRKERSARRNRAGLWQHANLPP